MTNEKNVNLASATVIFSYCAPLFNLKRKCVILCEFQASCCLVNTGLTPLVFVRLSVQMECDINTACRIGSGFQPEFCKT